MNAPSFLDFVTEDDMHVDPAPELPKFIALDLSDETKQFVEGTAMLDDAGIGIDLPTAVADLIDLLGNEQDAEYELAHSGYEMLPVDDFNPMYKELTEYVRVREEYAKAMLFHFKQFKLYLRGYLFYQFKDIDKSTLMLEKMEYPLTDNHERTIRNYARQVDLADRRRLQAPAAPRPDFSRILRDACTQVRPGAAVPDRAGLVLPPRFVRR